MNVVRKAARVMALQTETFDACMSQVQEKHRGATGTCPSLSCLTGAQLLLEVTCLGLSSAPEAQEELLQRPGCSSKEEANSNALDNPVCDAPAVAGSQR